MVINHNMMAMNTKRQMGINQANSQKSIEKLSSGLRINKAGDDAAGLSISEKMRGQIRGLNQASRNAQDGISLVQSAEGALQETQAILQRMRELSVQSANDTNVSADRTAIQGEVDALAKEITRIAETTEFNTQGLLDGDFSGTFQIGANKDQSLDLSINDMGSKALAVGNELVAASGVLNAASAGGSTIANFYASGATIATGDVATTGDATQIITSAGSGTLSTAATSYVGATAGTADITASQAGYYNASDNSLLEAKATQYAADTEVTKGINVSSQTNANTAIETINTAIETVSTERSKLGAYQNRLEHTIKNLDTSAENLQASESRIRDVDMAKEMMAFQKNNILQQAAQSMLAQANQAPQGVLQLLR